MLLSPSAFVEFGRGGQPKLLFHKETEKMSFEELANENKKAMEQLQQTVEQYNETCRQIIEKLSKSN